MFYSSIRPPYNALHILGKCNVRSQWENCTLGSIVQTKETFPSMCFIRILTMFQVCPFEAQTCGGTSGPYLAEWQYYQSITLQWHWPSPLFSHRSLCSPFEDSNQNIPFSIVYCFSHLQKRTPVPYHFTCMWKCMFL